MAANVRRKIDPIGVTQSNHSWQWRDAEAIQVADFAVDRELRRVRCPEGYGSTSWGVYAVMILHGMAMGMLSLNSGSSPTNEATPTELRAVLARDPRAFVDLVLGKNANFELDHDLLTSAEAVELADVVARASRGDLRVLRDPARVMRLLGPAGTARAVKRVEAWMDFDEGGEILFAQANFVAAAKPLESAPYGD